MSTPAEIAAGLGVFPRMQPAEAWGNGLTPRAGTAIGWSSRVVVPPTGGIGGTGGPIPIHKFVSPTGQPELFNVTVNLAAAGASQSPVRVGVWLRVRWTLGVMCGETDVDVTNGTASFQLAADSIDASLFNQVADGVPSDVEVTIATTLASGVAASRTARRTLQGSGAPGPASAVTIPRWSQQVQVVPDSGPPSTWIFEIRDATGATIQAVYVDTSQPQYPMIELPGAAFDIVVSAAGGAPKLVSYLFVLGF